MAASDYLERARALVPLIAGAAARAERERRVPDDVRQALHAAGLMRMLLPAQFGGGEVDPSTFVQVIETLAAADASTAWCVNQACGCSMSTAYLKPEVAAAMYAAPDSVMAWGPGAGQAIEVDEIGRAHV